MNKVSVSFSVEAEGGDEPGDIVDRLDEAIRTLKLDGITITSVDVDDWDYWHE